MRATSILSLHLLFLLYSKSGGADPLESLIRNGWLMLRDYGEKVISNIAIPRTSDVPERISSSFQLDPDEKKALDTLAQMMNTCPRGVPVRDIKGTWHVTKLSKRMLHTTFVDIHEAIEKLSSGMSVSSRKSLFSLFKSDPVMRCFQITVLDDSTSSPFELSYFSNDNQRKSIVGQLSRASAAQITLHLASIIDVPLIAVYASSTLLILSQTDTVPTACDSFLVIERSPAVTSSSTSFSEIQQTLFSFGAYTASNPIITMSDCSHIPTKLPSDSNSIIKPASQVGRSRFNQLL